MSQTDFSLTDYQAMRDFEFSLTTEKFQASLPTYCEWKTKMMADYVDGIKKKQREDLWNAKQDEWRVKKDQTERAYCDNRKLLYAYIKENDGILVRETNLDTIAKYTTYGWKTKRTTRTWLMTFKKDEPINEDDIKAGRRVPMVLTTPKASCCVCFEDDNAKELLPCGHDLCSTCIRKLKNRSDDGDVFNCPMCRQKSNMKTISVAKRLKFVEIPHLAKKEKKEKK
jgi:hypothetical protein